MDDESSNGVKTPRVEPLSGTAINLLDLALATESVAVGMREAALQLRGADELARARILQELGGRVTRLGGTFVEAGQALIEEAGA